MKRILITGDYSPETGWFWKEDLLSRLRSLSVQCVLCSPQTSVALSQIHEVDGLLIPGGLLDIPVKAYTSESPHPRTKENEKRYEFEKLVLTEYLKTQKAFLGICWGMQLFNVALGGSLIQHLPDHPDFFVQHEQSGDKSLPTHDCIFERSGSGTKLFGVEHLRVNSTHHQAVCELGEGLILEAKSEDGVIEAISLSGHPFAWGVEWHPERLEKDPIIPAFLKACAD